MQDELIDQGEDGGIGADSKGQREYGDGGEQRRFAECSERVAQVLQDTCHARYTSARKGYQDSPWQKVAFCIWRIGVLASHQMALVDLTKQLATEAFLSATRDPPAPAAAPPQADNTGAIIFGQIHGLQKALKEDEELVVWFANAGEKLRVMEIFLPSPKLAVLSGHDAERNLTRVISPVDALQLVAKVMKVPPGAKPSRVGLVMPKAKDSNG